MDGWWIGGGLVVDGWWMGGGWVALVYDLDHEVFNIFYL